MTSTIPFATAPAYRKARVWRHVAQGTPVEKALALEGLTL